MPSPNQRIGELAEDRAAEFLLAKGWTIHGRHISSRYGEIDILAQDGETIVAVEVKARQGGQFGPAVEGVTSRKLERLKQALESELARRGWEHKDIRLDVVTFDADREGSEQLEHLTGVGG